MAGIPSKAGSQPLRFGLSVAIFSKRPFYPTCPSSNGLSVARMPSDLSPGQKTRDRSDVRLKADPPSDNHNPETAYLTCPY
jgi:hypothetical protein